MSEPAEGLRVVFCDHPCSARVLDSGGWSCRRCEQFCEPPCPTCATGDVPRSGAHALIAAEVEALEGACHDGSGLGCDADPCVENVSRSAVLRIVGAALSELALPQPDTASRELREALEIIAASPSPAMSTDAIGVTARNIARLALRPTPTSEPGRLWREAADATAAAPDTDGGWQERGNPGDDDVPAPPDALDVTAYRLRGTAMAVEKERKAWLRHSPQWTDEEVGSVIDRIADALRAALTQPEEAE